MSTVGLYIHIPYCVRKCNYCDFYSLAGSDSSYDDYLGTLIRNLEFWSKKLHNRIVDTIYIGGGTPSVLGTDRLCRILGNISELFNVANDAEITIEVNPNSTNLLDFSALHRAGVNRVSMGLQSADDEELRLLGRPHLLIDAQKTIERIKSGGISNFSLDVMLGIPQQNMASLSDTLDFCIESGASHISTYMLKIEKNTPFYLNADKYDFADEDLQADMYEFTSEYLKNHGFRHYEISNFCKDNKFSRHNMKYWQLDDYVGIGPSAHSMLDGSRFYYPRRIQDFADNQIVFESEGRTPDEYLMLSLRTDTGFSARKYKELFGLAVTADFVAEAAKLEKLGLLHQIDDSIVLTEKGFLVSNAVISQLLSKGIG